MLNHFRNKGYSAILLETDTIGCGQTVAAQGIIHSGLKYAFAGKINKLAESISAMPDLWRTALRGEGDIDLSQAHTSAESQFLLIPGGLMGGLVNLVTKQALGNNVRQCPKDEWPEEIRETGFKGSVVYMDEPVLDVPSTLRALAEPHRNFIRQINWDNMSIDNYKDGIRSLSLDEYNITAKRYIFTAAGNNHKIASTLGHNKGLATQKRPLLQGMIKNAPYPLYAHLVGTSDKPVATITTHKMQDGTLIWYLGGGAAEHSLNTNPLKVYQAICKSFGKYLPHIDLDRFEWSVLPINRIEGKSDTQGWLPDTPTIHTVGNTYYCWPTKLTFAPMLSNMLMEKMEGLATSFEQPDVSFLPYAEYTKTPWDKAQWKKDV